MTESKQLVGLACVLCIIGLAGAMISTNYNLSWHVIGGGGGAMSSMNYQLDGTVGQVIGVAESTNYRIEAGYWSGTNVTTTPTPTPPPTVSRWDINEDCTVNFIDLTILSAHWLETPSSPYPRYDINEDGSVNFIDLTILSAHWLETTC